MDIGEQRQANLLVLAPVGRIDNLTSTEFQTRLLAAVTSGGADVVIDFSGVEYISSAGLRALMTASRMKPKERRLAVVRLNAIVHEIFTISRFSHLVPIFATIEEASAAWEAPAEPQPVVPGADAADRADEHAARPFWGTRGSLPAPLRERSVRAKIREALLAARGHALDTPEAIDAFIDHALPFSVRGTFGGNTSCVEIVTGGDEYLLCDLGTGVREFGNRVVRRARPRAQALLQRVPVAPALGPHHGVPVLCARLYPGQPYSHLRLPYDLRDGVGAPSNRRRVSRSISASLGGDARIHHLEPGRRIRGRRVLRLRDEAIPLGRFLRLPVFPRRQVDRLFDGLRAQIFACSTKPTLSSSSTATPIC